MLEENETTREDFEVLYRSMNNRVLAEKFDVSVNTIINTALRLGLKMKGKGNRRGKVKIRVVYGKEKFR